MHSLKNIFSLQADGHAHLLTLGIQLLGKLCKGDLTLGGIHCHHHGEVTLHDGLADIQDIDLVVGEEMAMSIRLQREDIFDAMHKI